MLLAGDFNVFRYDLSDYAVKNLYIANAQWVDYFGILEDEYEHLLRTLKAEGKFEVVNLWDRDNPGTDCKCITTGDVVIVDDGEDGQKQPKETILTLEDLDKCAENCYDYIFEIKQPNSCFKTSETKVVEMFVEKGTIGAYGNTREYTQLSDHYGLSTTI